MRWLIVGAILLVIFGTVRAVPAVPGCGSPVNLRTCPVGTVIAQGTPDASDPSEVDCVFEQFGGFMRLTASEPYFNVTLHVNSLCQVVIDEKCQDLALCPSVDDVNGQFKPIELPGIPGACTGENTARAKIKTEGHLGKDLTWVIEKMTFQHACEDGNPRITGVSGLCNKTSWATWYVDYCIDADPVDRAGAVKDGTKGGFHCETGNFDFCRSNEHRHWLHAWTYGYNDGSYECGFNSGGKLPMDKQPETSCRLLD